MAEYTELPVGKAPSRDISLDIMKGIAIVLVVIGHVITAVRPADYKYDPVFRFCYSFHMPLFIFISGWLTGCKSDDKIRKRSWILNRFYRLMIPYMIWTAVKGVISGRYDLIRLLFVEPVLWFLINLFLSDLIIFISCHAGKYKTAVTGGIYMLFFVCYLIMRRGNLVINDLALYFPFYFAGMVVSRYKSSIILQAAKKYLWLSLILYPLSMLMYSYEEYDIWIGRIQALLGIDRFGSVIHAGLICYNHYVVAPLGICFIWFLTRNLILRAKHISNVLSYIGLMTMYIYICEGFFTVYPFDSAILNGLCMFGIRIAVPILAALVFKRLPHMNKLLFGQ